MTQRTISHGGYGSPTATGQGVEAINVRTPFGYMFPQLANDHNARLPEDDPATVRKNLKALGRLMASAGADKGESQTVPAGYTYWGQFIDHDITLNDLDPLKGKDIIDDFTPMAPNEVTSKVVNLRRPILDLDSVFGDGPHGEAARFYEDDGIRLKMGENTPVGFKVTPPPDNDFKFKRDLPRREDGTPLIGDTRNDENLIVAQLHVGFMRFYNAVVEWVEKNEHLAGDALLGRAVQLTRWQYQWLVVNDYLMTVAEPSVVQDIIDHGGRFFNRAPADPFFDMFMPLEFSAAIFRFGHSMVRAEYDFNRNFGRNPGGPVLVQAQARFEQIFEFTGRGGGAVPKLPDNWIIEWDRFFNKQDPNADHFARRFDTGLALPLATMVNETKEPPHDSLVGEQKSVMEHLAMRNLLRGYLFSLPTGQAVARAIGETELTPAEIKEGNSGEVNSLLENAGFIDKTPLWYYILKEAEVKAHGNTLGPVGSRIVAETIIGLIRADRSSYLTAPGDWEPGKGVRLSNEQPILTIMDMLLFAGVAVAVP